MLSRRSMVPTAITTAVIIASVSVWWLHFHAASPASPMELERMVPAKAPLPVPEHTSKTDSVTDPVFKARAEISVNEGSDAKGSGAADDIKHSGAAGGAFVMSSSILVACNEPGIKAAHICDRLYADQVLAGYDPRDSSSLDTSAPDYAAAMRSATSSLRIGIPRDFFFEGLEPDI
jgi:hypothetical protein